MRKLLLKQHSDCPFPTLNHLQLLATGKSWPFGQCLVVFACGLVCPRQILIGISTYRDLNSASGSSGRICPADCESLNSSRTSPSFPSAFRKSMMYVELKPTTIGSPEYGVSIVSSLSPDSVELELIFSSLLSSRSRIAPD